MTRIESPAPAAANFSGMEMLLADRFAHECRTPLTVITEFAALVNEGIAGPVNARQSEYLGVIGTRVDELNTLLDDFVDLCRAQSGQVSVVRHEQRVAELCDLVWPAISHKAARRGIEVTRSIAADVPHIFVDHETASRAILNLAVEEMRSVPKGGVMTLWAAPAGMSSVRISCAPQDPVIETVEPNVAVRGLPHRTNACLGSFGLALADELATLNWGSLEQDYESPGKMGLALEFPRASPRHLLGETVRRWNADGALPQWISIVEIQFAQVITDPLVAMVESAVRRALQRHDLLMHDTTDRWILLARRDPSELDRLFRAVQRHWHDEEPGGVLEMISMPVLTALGSWKLSCMDDSLLEEVQGACGVLTPLAETK